ncbi:Kinase, CMGC GSK [Giardia lamblia P15]|uniref:Kinase, CMGC GSK n=1 Tax=Giardia intestinalis (strain P15) TaxID=658858 RepID=E1F6A9_GIAIA|nr:Kinase, CMGC GSK [Giardia lamblia P15]
MSDDETAFPPEFELQLGKPLDIPGEKGEEGIQVVPEKVIGKGSFGVVYLVKSLKGNTPLALKLVLQDRRYKNREFQIMRTLVHPCVCRLVKGTFIPSVSSPDDLILYLLMDYYPETIHSIYRQYSRLRQHVPLLIVRLITYQLARSLAYLHYHNIAHRDCKPTNVLIDPLTYRCVLCDFGSAKQLVPQENNVAYICSRFYRAPELVIGNQNYTCAIDIWSFGCIMAEILLGQPLFPGDSSIDQLVEIVRVLGSPTAEEFLAMNPTLKSVKFKDVKRYPFSKIFRSKAHTDAVDLLTKVLVYDPKKRPTAMEILAHPFYDILRDPDTLLPNGERLPAFLFEFTEEERKAAGPELMAILTKNREQFNILSSH